MKKLFFLLLSISLMSQVFGAELSDYQKALNTTKRLEKVGKTSSSLVTEAAEELYQDRVTLELALKKVDAEFNEQHKNYTDLRKAYINDRKNKNAAQAYYAELDTMTKALFINSESKNEINELRKNLILSLIAFQDTVADELIDEDKKHYLGAIKRLKKAYKIKRNEVSDF